MKVVLTFTGLLHIQAKRPYKLSKLSVHNPSRRAVNIIEWGVIYTRSTQTVTLRVNRPLIANSSTSSTSQSHSEKKQTFHFRASFDTKDIQLVAKIRKFYQHNIELSIKNLQRKQSYNTQGDLFPQKVNYKELSDDDKEIFRRFQGKTLKSLTDEMMDIGVGKKRAERPPKPWIANWSKEQLVERMSAEIEENMGIVKATSTSSSETETTDSDSSTSESKTQEDSDDSPRKQPSKKGKKMDSKKRKKSQEDSDSDSESESTDETQSKKKKVVVEHSSPEEDQSYDGERYEIGSEDLDELLRENNEKSAAERILDVNLGSDDPSSQGHTEQSSVNRPAESMLSLVQESASESADSNIMVVREETPSEGLAIVPIQVFVPVSQTTTVPEFEETPETDFEPTPLLQIEGTTKTYPAAEDAAALMMMARTASYVPKTDPMPSFSIGLTDSSREEAATQEGASTQEVDRAKTPETANLLEQLEDLVQKIANSAAKEESKSPQIQRETGGESFGKFETPAGINQNTGDMKEKCYIWGTRVKTYADGSTNEFDNVCTLIAQDKCILNRMHLASLQAESYIEAEIVSAMCLILNQKNDKRFQEQVYCLPPDIVNMAVSKHPNGEFISPKTNKEFRVEDYPMFIPFIDAKKLTSHRYAIGGYG
ncbi:uncharacterized protein DS421_13g405080 [Arachis hypogaea]|nr:uncharacterized protein DS421_13g405080 [Arachis hypogaea]